MIQKTATTYGKLLPKEGRKGNARGDYTLEVDFKKETFNQARDQDGRVIERQEDFYEEGEESLFSEGMKANWDSIDNSKWQHVLGKEVSLTDGFSVGEARARRQVERTFLFNERGEKEFVRATLTLNTFDAENQTLLLEQNVGQFDMHLKEGGDPNQFKAYGWALSSWVTTENTYTDDARFGFDPKSVLVTHFDPVSGTSISVPFDFIENLKTPRAGNRSVNEVFLKERVKAISGKHIENANFNSRDVHATSMKKILGYCLTAQTLSPGGGFRCAPLMWKVIYDKSVCANLKTLKSKKLQEPIKWFSTPSIARSTEVMTQRVMPASRCANRG